MRLETGCLSARESTLPEALRPASLGSGSECPGIRRTPRGGSRARSSGEYPDPLARGSRRHIAIRIECPTTRGRRKRFLAAALERRRRVEGSLAGDGEARGRCVLRDRGGLESGRFLRGARLLEGSRRERDAKTLGLRRAPRGRIRSTFGRLPDRAAGAARDLPQAEVAAVGEQSIESGGFQGDSPDPRRVRGEPRSSLLIARLAIPLEVRFADRARMRERPEPPDPTNTRIRLGGSAARARRGTPRGP